MLRRSSSSPSFRRPLAFTAPPVRTPSPVAGSARRVERPLLSAMDHRPTPMSSELHVSRGMATVQSAPPPVHSRQPSVQSMSMTDGANLRRKIVANMAQQSSGFGRS